MLAGFDGGAFLGGRHLLGRVKPELWVQKLTAGGTPVGDVVKIDSLGAVNGVRAVRRAADHAAWRRLDRRDPWSTVGVDFQPYTLLTQVDVRHPLRTPDVFNVPSALPVGSVLLQDARGLLVASGPSQPGGTVSLPQFNHGGRAAGQPDSLSLTSVNATSLSRGERPCSRIVRHDHPAAHRRAR